MKSLVLSRYNEDIEWIKKYEKENLKIYVYNKGQKIELNQKNVIVKERDNVGREAETYFNHIVENYNNLDNLIFFSQANPFEHDYGSFDFFKEFDLFLNLSDNLKKWFYWYGVEVNNIFNMHGGIDHGSKKYPLINDHPNPNNSSIRILYESCFGPIKEQIESYKVGGFFSLSSDVILKYSKDSYFKARKFLNFEEQKQFPGHYKSNCIEAHLFEKMYGKIFG